MPRRKPTDMVLLNLRIREELRRYIAQAAKKRGHSLNSEIVRRLQGSREQDVRQEALQQIESTTHAIESTINAVDQFLTLVKSPGPADLPELNNIKPKDQR
jgi:uncharacterized protein (DUF1778 family)